MRPRPPYFSRKYCFAPDRGFSSDSFAALLLQRGSTNKTKRGGKKGKKKIIIILQRIIIGAGTPTTGGGHAKQTRPTGARSGRFRSVAATSGPGARRTRERERERDRCRSGTGSQGYGRRVGWRAGGRASVGRRAWKKRCRRPRLFHAPRW